MAHAESERVCIAIIGAGFGGIGLALRLLAAGIEDFLILERTDGVGGVWRDNSYPGAACDVPARLYSFSFAPWPHWSRRFAPQAEIRGYLEHLVERHGLAAKLRLRSEVQSARYDAATARWQIALGDGRGVEAQFLVAATGQLSRPRVPALAGLDRFAGASFHSARWRHDVALEHKHLAVIGTGASAIQIVPELARVAARLTLYQRTPPYVIAKPDREYGTRERALVAHFPLLARLARLGFYLGHEARALGFVSYPPLIGLFRREFRRHLERAIADPALRAALTPHEPMGCKRILTSNDYYPALARDNVELVATPIERIEADRIVCADGSARRAEVIVLATGFEANDFLAPIEIVGRDGLALASAWRNGAEAYLGMLVAGFPNFFVLYGPNTNLGHNSIVYMLECQFRYVLGCLAALARRGVHSIEVRAEAQRRFNAWVQGAIRGTVFARDCRSWYRDAQGRQVNNWPGYSLGYRWRTRAPRESDLLFADTHPSRL
jgi:cation diffusion facilitator CzcD-associated flavoprotein CzcO